MRISAGLMNARFWIMDDPEVGRSRREKCRAKMLDGVETDESKDAG
jgi:hypothetical protein